MWAVRRLAACAMLAIVTAPQTCMSHCEFACEELNGDVSVECNGCSTESACHPGAAGFSSVDEETRADDPPMRWLGEWYADPSVHNALRLQLEAGGIAIIHGFLAAHAAAAIESELNATQALRWDQWRGDHPGFQYQFSVLERSGGQHGRGYRRETHPTLTGLRRLLDSPAMRSWAEALLGSRFRIDRALVQATWYQPGDYTTIHNDNTVAAQTLGARRLAFVLHLPLGPWRPQWGGDLVFVQPHLSLHPTYNTMTLFPVGVDNVGSHLHLVSPVSKAAPLYARRYAVSGWYYSPVSAEQQESIDSLNKAAAVERQRRLREFALPIRGEDARALDELDGRSTYSAV